VDSLATILSRTSKVSVSQTHFTRVISILRMLAVVGLVHPDKENLKIN